MKRGFKRNGLCRIAMALIATVMTLGAQSCLRDDIEPCPDPYNVYLRIITDYEKESLTRHSVPAARSWYDGAINSVVVFVFDEDENLVTYWQGGAYTLGQPLEVPFTLPDGRNYHFVAGTNIGDDRHYSMSHVGEALTGVHRSQLAVNLDLPEDRLLTQDIEHRHYGELDDQWVEVGMEKDNNYEVVMKPHTYKVNFIIAGMDPGTDQYKVDVTDTNCHHDFRKNCMTGMLPYTHRRTMVHEPSTRAERSRVITSTNLLQIGDETETTFKLTKVVTTTLSDGRIETAENYYPVTNVLEAIKQSYNDELETIKTNNPDMTDDEALADMLEEKFEYNIVMRLAEVGFDFTIMEWDYVGNTGGLSR